ncbi:uncharacterized protein V2V93DRAFT_314646, partial [Kockiozyma suomiensis]|uniref:uncharacterized protein n=1 Tax=Kockiozyma suomiensis TaxID=1337062 RepID=UPI0033438D71
SSPRKRALSPSPGRLTPKRYRATRAMSRPSLVSPLANSAVLFDSPPAWPLHVFQPGADASVQISPSQLLRVPKQHCTILAFFDGCDDLHVRAAASLSGFHGAVVYAVAVSPPASRNDLTIPLLFDPRAALTHHARATHPLGGGLVPMPILLVLDHRLRRRSFLPVGCGRQTTRPLSIDDIKYVLEDIIKYIHHE